MYDKIQYCHVHLMVNWDVYCRPKDGVSHTTPEGMSASGCLSPRSMCQPKLVDFVTRFREFLLGLIRFDAKKKVLGASNTYSSLVQ